MKTHNLLLAFLFVAPALSAAPALPTKADSVALVWSSGQYRYDAVGNIIAIGTNAYRYDPVGRLIDGTAHTPSYTNRQTFRYDPYGNLDRIETTMQRAGATGIAAAVDQLAINSATNRITDLSRCQPGVNCISGDYDAAGNQIASSAGGTFAYDALGMLTHLRAGLKNEQYVYDADNERIATVAPSQTRYTLRDLGGKVVRELTYSASTWTWQKDYVYRDGSLLAAITPTQHQHFHLDHLGSPRLITDDAGFKLAAHTYWPFGAEAPGSDADTERMKFTGHERDFGTGPGLDLDYMHARFYGVAGGRFLTVDPKETARAMQPQSWNRYVYSGNNPLGFIDPDGKEKTLSIMQSFSVRQTLPNALKELHPFSNNAALRAAAVYNGYSYSMTMFANESEILDRLSSADTTDIVAINTHGGKGGMSEAAFFDSKSLTLISPGSIISALNKDKSRPVVILAGCNTEKIGRAIASNANVPVFATTNDTGMRTGYDAMQMLALQLMSGATPQEAVATANNELSRSEWPGRYVYIEPQPQKPSGQ